MQVIQQELSNDARELSVALEKCTDTCKNESDMLCINSCGSDFMKKLNRSFSSKLREGEERINKLTHL